MTTNTVIIGAGPAGLATAAALKKKNVPFTILERDSSIGSSWRRHYERLHLHTPRNQSALPFRPYPRSYPRYPSRDQFVAYLEDYVRAFGLQPELAREVLRCSPRKEGGWTVETSSGSLECRNLVIASGFSRVAHRPSWPGQESFGGTVLHSSEYWNGERFRGQRVLVAGFGNSGAEIALDLFEHGALPAISIRGDVNVVPREILGIPVTSFALAMRRLPPAVVDGLNRLTIRLAVGDLTKYGIRKRAKGPAVDIAERARVPVIDVGTIDRVRRGDIGIRTDIDRWERSEIVFTDGLRERYDAVILATGFTTGLRGLFPQQPALFDVEGRPFRSGREAAQNLYFCGFRVVPTGHLREISREALSIAKMIGG